MNLIISIVIGGIIGWLASIGLIIAGIVGLKLVS